MAAAAWRGALSRNLQELRFVERRENEDEESPTTLLTAAASFRNSSSSSSDALFLSLTKKQRDKTESTSALRLREARASGSCLSEELLWNLVTEAKETQKKKAPIAF